MCSEEKPLPNSCPVWAAFPSRWLVAYDKCVLNSSAFVPLRAEFHFLVRAVSRSSPW